MLSCIRVRIFRLYQVSNDFDRGQAVQWHMVTVGEQRAFRDRQDLVEYDCFRLETVTFSGMLLRFCWNFSV